MPQFNPALTDAEISAAFPGQFTTVVPVYTGGQGSVFRCERTNGSIIALKIYTPDPGAQIDERTQREVQALRTITSCATIVRLDDEGEATIRGDVCRFVATTFIAGESLESRLRRGRLSDSAVMRIGHDIAFAIMALWEPNRIVHRDIKPPNIMLATTGAAVLIDLGVARHTSLSSLTATGNTWGTRGYQSPEHYACRKGLTSKSDVYALGVVLQECLLGGHPSGRDQHRLVTTTRVTAALVSGVDPSLGVLIDAMQNINPVRRPRPDQIAAALNSKVQGATTW